MTRILVVDDHELLRRGLRSILNGAFPELVLVETADAKAALEAAGKEPCDLALVDINLPGRSGLDLLQDLPGLHVVGEATDGLEAVAMARALVPDLSGAGSHHHGHLHAVARRDRGDPTNQG